MSIQIYTVTLAKEDELRLTKNVVARAHFPKIIDFALVQTILKTVNLFYNEKSTMKIQLPRLELSRRMGHRIIKKKYNVVKGT